MTFDILWKLCYRFGVQHSYAALTDTRSRTRNDMNARHRDGMISCFCLFCTFAGTICWVAAIVFSLDWGGELKSQLTRADLIFSYAGLGFVIVQATATHWQFYNYHQYREREDLLRSHSFCPRCAKASDLSGVFDTSESE